MSENKMISNDYIPWVEKYRSHTLDDIVEHEDAITKIKEQIATSEIPHMIFEGTPGTGKTTTALAMVNDLYKNLSDDIVKNSVKELNASDARGINTVRTEIKKFNEAKKNPAVPFKILILDEADNMTGSAQQGLRRQMEKYTHNCRMILICNYSNKIIPPIQSRCSVIHFKPLTTQGIKQRIIEIAEKESVKITQNAVNILSEISYGDMRKAVNNLQATSILNMNGKEITEEDLRAITGTVEKKSIQSIIDNCMNGSLRMALNDVEKLLTMGASGKEIAIQMFRAVGELNLSDKLCALITSRISDAVYNITIGGSEKIQLRGLVAGIYNGGI